MARPVTHAQVLALRGLAAACSDLWLVLCCDAALNGQQDAWQHCEKVIIAALDINVGK